jgi:alkanesulfonate monooxygenase SsuD/methylene tetrahydromethanopterin reductase-like flavin-dependent oxidoreductase (luciferase family)
MSAPIIGRDEKELHAHFARIVEKIPSLGERPVEEMLPAMAERGWLVGSPAQIVDELGRREEAGISRTMLQHHANDDFETLGLIASEVLPQVQRS